MRYDAFGLLAECSDEEIYEALEKRALVRELRADGLSQEEIARIAGVTLSSIRRMCPGSVGKVPVAPLREAFEASPYSTTHVARSVGWWRKNGTVPDTARVRRMLFHQVTADAEIVGLMAEAIGIAPWAVLPDDGDECAPTVIPSGAMSRVAA